VVEQLEDISRISLAFYLLSLEDFGDFSQIMYFILILSTRKFYLVKRLIYTYDFCNNHHPHCGRTRIWSSDTDWSRIDVLS
jgi:hypothetical protein